MRIGRIIRNNEEEYGILQDGKWYPQSFTRSDKGIETFLDQDTVDLNLQNGIDLDKNPITWLPPIAFPGKILCIGRNYAEHSREQGMDPEQQPLIFSKFPTSMIGHNAEVPYPNHTNHLDYEVELAVIIGKQVHQLSQKDDPWSYIFGYTIANDLTARDVQQAEKQWTRGKGFDASLPIGPTIVTSEEVDKPTDNPIWLEVNGEPRQNSNTSHMIFSIPYLIQYISQTITLEPGDIILTGTPEGVGYYMEPKQTLQKGDAVSCGVEGIGTLEFSIK